MNWRRVHIVKNDYRKVIGVCLDLETDQIIVYLDKTGSLDSVLSRNATNR